jgi:AcrR family transcriptional regulator
VKIQPKDDRSTRGSRRSLVLEEAAKALNSRGVSQTSLTEIADRVGVHRAALYYYFEDQQDLVFQSYRRSCEMFARRLNEAMRAGGGAMAIIECLIDGMLSS